MRTILLLLSIVSVIGCKKSEISKSPIVGEWNLYERSIKSFRSGYMFEDRTLTLSDGIAGRINFEDDTKSSRGRYWIEGDSLYFELAGLIQARKFKITSNILNLSYEERESDDVTNKISELYMKAP